jgi:ABC-type nickel/cobalt efflux system permease component RcnA
MPYSKWALLLFGGGLVLGLVVVSADLPLLGWVASFAMAVGTALLPVALAADWWSHRPWKAPAKKSTGRTRRKRPAKPSSPRKRASKVR